jgi:hypothetical protein
MIAASRHAFWNDSYSTLGNNMRLILTTLLTCTALAVVAEGQSLNEPKFEGEVGFSKFINPAQHFLTFDNGLLFGKDWRFAATPFGILRSKPHPFGFADQTLKGFRESYEPNDLQNSVHNNRRYFINWKGNIGTSGSPESGVHPHIPAFTDPSLAGGYCNRFYGYCELTADPVGADSEKDWGGANFVTSIRYRRFVSPASDEFVTMSFGIRF